MNSASLYSLAGRYDNPIPPRFLAPIAFLKIPALYSGVGVYRIAGRRSQSPPPPRFLVAASGEEDGVLLPGGRPAVAVQVPGKTDQESTAAVFAAG
jgi:hypothetical protein